jgi:hypothetical protein
MEANTTSSKVMVAPDDQGNVIRVSKNNPEYGHVRLTQNRVTFNTQGWVNKKVASTLIHGTVEDLQTLEFKGDQELSGNIITREQTDPFNSNDPDRDLKIAGETGVICCAHGEPIYRKSFYDPSGNASDELVAHTNGDAIREANGNATSTTKKTMTQSELTNILEKSDKKAKKEEKVEDSKEEPVEVEDESFEL